PVPVSTTVSVRRSSIVPRRGLPETVRMRHDEHYVEALAASAGAPIGRLIPIDRIEPNPNQPRQVMGDLSELMASIAEKGIIEPLIVRQRGDHFQIIAGERRYQASVQVGLRELPVVIRDVDDNEIIEVALVEKLASQGGATRAEVRKDLAKPKAGRPKSYVFAFRAPSKAFALKLKFSKGHVARQEVISALEEILDQLRNE